MNYPSKKEPQHILFLHAHIVNDRLATGGDVRCGIIQNYFLKYGYKITVVAPHCLKNISNDCEIRRIPSMHFGSDSSVIANNPILILIAYVYRSIIVSAMLPCMPVGVVYSPGDFICDVFPVFIKKIFSRKFKWVCVVHHVNEDPKHRYGPQYLNKWMSYLLQNASFWMMKNSADKIFTVNSMVKDRLVSKGGDPQKITVIGNGVDVKKIDAVCVEKDKYLYDGVFLGRCNKTKGVEDLIRVWKIICAENKDARLAILAGLTHDLDYVKKLLMQYDMQQNVEIFAYLPEQDIYRIMKQSKIFLFPSYEEGWGIALNEALACEIPAVTYDLPVYNEMFTDGILKAPVGDIVAFAERVTRLLNDAPYRKELGQRGYAVAKKYDWGTVAHKEHMLIDELTDGKKNE